MVTHYQLAYCKTVLERNRRITLPVVSREYRHRYKYRGHTVQDSTYQYSRY